MSAAEVEISWAEKEARRFSKRWNENEEELIQQGHRLENLPCVRGADQGDPGGMVVMLPPKGDPENKSIGVIEIRWKEPHLIDLVVLVPARKFELQERIDDYGLPNVFSIELIGEKPSADMLVASERNVHADRLREGYPFVYPLAESWLAVGLRINIFELRKGRVKGTSEFVAAFAECFCFSGERNVALRADVEVCRGGEQREHWHWKNKYLVDGFTPLGLPEIPGGKVTDIGWLSNPLSETTVGPWITIDLGHRQRFDGICLYPLRRPSMGDVSGFGLPVSFWCRTSDYGTKGSFENVIPLRDEDLQYAGNNPIEFTFESVVARYVRFRAQRPWKQFKDYPGYFGLSEFAVLNQGENIALGAAVTSSDQIGRVCAHGDLFWSEASLTNGQGPNGTLVSRRKWLLMLNERLQLERRRAELREEQQEIAGFIRRCGWSGMAVLAAAGFFVSVILPFRYRVVRKREVCRVRERIAGDLHDDVGSNLGSIRLLSELALKKMPESGELNKIRQVAAETVSAVRDIVWLLRARSSQRLSVAKHLQESSAILLEALEWSFEVDEGAELFLLPDEKVQDLILFYREAIHNVVKHSGAGTVKIRLRTDGSDFVLIIEDDGCGIPEEKLFQPETLWALKCRVERLGGTLNVISKVGEGTGLTLKIR